MLGPSLLVAPVFVPEGEESEYYLPAGRWTSFFHPERVIQGPVWVKEVVPLDEVPVWVRGGSVLVLGPAGIGRPDYNLGQRVEVRAYELDEDQAVTVDVPAGEGLKITGTVTVQKKSGEVLVEGASVDVAAITVFASGQQFKTEVEKGKTQITLAV
jgi:alpha-glucosidase (family GH31 glycosyl hydrolase)